MGNGSVQAAASFQRDRVPELGRTFAEMDPQEKHRWSHRGAAVRALVQSGLLDEL